MVHRLEYLNYILKHTQIEMNQILMCLVEKNYGKIFILLNFKKGV